MIIYELKEKRNHGTKDFPVEVYHPTGLRMYYHWHEEHEFIYILSGNARIRIGTDLFELKEGECAYVKPGEMHSISTDDESSLDYYAVVFHPSFLTSELDICNKYLNSKYVIKSYFTSDTEEQKIIPEMVYQLCTSLIEKSFAYELKVKAYLFHIFAQIFEHELFEIASCDNKKVVEKLGKVISYIHTNCRSYITVEELAKVSGYSASHFSRFFKELTGKTPIDYINRQRIYSACEMLKQTNLSIIEVSLECGFENVGYFIKTFKKYTDYTPQRYKQNYNHSLIVSDKSC